METGSCICLGLGKHFIQARQNYPFDFSRGHSANDKVTMFVRDPERDFTQTDEEAEESLEVGLVRDS